MAGIGFAGQGYTWNRDNLAQKNRRAGYERREKNYAEHAYPLKVKQPTPEELLTFRQQFYARQRKKRRREYLL